MALPGPEGNRRRSLFPRLFPKAFTRAFTRFFSRLLRGLRERTTSGRQTARDQLLSSDLIFLSNASNGLSLGSKARQLFRSGLIFFSNCSIEVSPLIFSPLTKKVGVES